MAGYSGTPLLKKLGIKPGYRMYVHEPPPRYFDWIHPLPAEVVLQEKLSGKVDFIHVFVTDRKHLSSVLPAGKRCLKNEGMLWVSWPKKSSGVVTELDENTIRACGLKSGLVDVKVCAVDDVWSGLKFVIPVKERK